MRAPLLRSGIALILLGSCFGGGSGWSSAGSSPTGRMAATAGGGAGPDRAASTGLHLPSILSPEERLIRQTRIYWVKDGAGQQLAFQETLTADGLGSFALSLDAVQEAGQTSLQPPSAIWLSTYDWRQRYLVHYRDVHVGDEVLIRNAYHWTDLGDIGTVEGGRPCHSYLAESRYGYGSIRLEVDQVEGVLLGWTISDGSGVEISRLEATVVDYAPVVSGMVWSTPPVPERPYLGAVDDPLLGFSPYAAHYFPGGFEAAGERLILAEGVYGSSVPNLYAEILNDGLRNVLLAEQTDPSSVGKGLGAVSFAKQVDLGGVRVVDGHRVGLAVFVVGTLPMDELLATYRSVSR